MIRKISATSFIIALLIILTSLIMVAKRPDNYQLTLPFLAIGISLLIHVLPLLTNLKDKGRLLIAFIGFSFILNSILISQIENIWNFWRLFIAWYIIILLISLYFAAKSLNSSLNKVFLLILFATSLLLITTLIFKIDNSVLFYAIRIGIALLLIIFFLNRFIIRKKAN